MANLNVKASLLRACIDNHNVKGALEGFESMKASGGTCADARVQEQVSERFALHLADDLTIELKAFVP